MSERKSTRKGAPMRSYGFLSHGGPEGAPGEDPKAHHKSRGKRKIAPNSDAKSKELATKPTIRPFNLERKS
ncbi:hypothetical protein TRICHSKD4_1671 [Roseibium sp. TrichSKD4]|uniref:hypothetical protein n=1 Tax=Roseibium sp. TrichSKD4 TaxID=744980 RepID=UPI0001E563B6|nr:hypothetical protein [Roseibium sp. TrichSKD4]EFO33048.1 hypothetical protein TRICHSKD4_1671 [Roseibium sp. TrichSKD4]